MPSRTVKPPGGHRLRAFLIPLDLDRELRVLAARNGETVTDCLLRLIREEIARAREGAA